MIDVNNTALVLEHSFEEVLANALLLYPLARGRDLSIEGIDASIHID